jgi:hypothetical protein
MPETGVHDEAKRPFTMPRNRRSRWGGACSQDDLAGQLACCLDGVCTFGDGGPVIVDCAGANEQIILASSYDQSCEGDSDCVGVAQGNACWGFLGCPSAAINVGAQAQYSANVAMTNVALCMGGEGDCGRSFVIGDSDGRVDTEPVGPCCRSGICEFGVHCLLASDAGIDAEGGVGSADTGTSDVTAGG